ncbi:MAG: S-layer homology domain-containing protein [Oscillospiraceae bacterium]|nr:S-layer homology domain-containing protein [Oscillospiraceae bacterium]
MHVYQETGEYTIRLTVTDDEGNEAVLLKEITVKERALVGTVRIHIVDEYGKVVSNAPVYFDLGSENQVVRGTDSSGNVTFTAEVGKHVVGCVIPDNEWLPAKKEVIVTAGEVSSVSMTLVHHTMIEGQFEITRMTFDEIQAAGINTALPENQHIVKVNVALTYSSQQINTTFMYNQSTGKTIAKPTIVTTSDGQKRQITPVVLHSGGSSGTGGSWNFGSDATIAYLDVPVEGSFLKEFFDVKLHIINNAASTFRMTDNVITLNVPEGLSIVATAGTESGNVVSIPEIAGQTTKTISWILRGDTAGSYQITADYSGILAEFNEPIYTTFVAEDPIEVYGLTALKLIVELNSTIMYDGFYFNLSVQNNGKADMYLPSVDVVSDSITTYLKKAKEHETGDAVTPKVELLNQMLSNSSGFTQLIGKDETITTLSPGMTYTKKYVVYGATGYNNLLYFKEAAAEITEGYGVQVEIVETDMDLYSIDHALEKIDAINNDLTKYRQYTSILNGSNYYYVQQSLETDGDWLAMTGEELYNIKEAILGFDFTYSPDELSEQTRKTVSQLMIDESMQQAVEANMHTKEIKLVANIVNLASGYLEDQSKAEDAEKLKNFFGNTKELNGAAKQIYSLTDSDATVGERFLTVAASAGLSYSGREALKDYFASHAYKQEQLNQFSKTCETAGKLIEYTAGALEVWEDSVQLENDLIQIAAAYEESEVLLDMLINNTQNHSSINKALRDIKSDMKDAKSAKIDYFHDEIINYIGQEIDKELLFKQIPKALDKAFETNIAVTVSIAKTIIELADFAFDWSGTIEDIHLLRVQTTLSFALNDSASEYGLNSQNEQEAVQTLKALKYVIKMRMIGEQSFAAINSEKSEKKQKEILDKINAQRGTPYASLDEYANDTLANMLRMRDALFSDYYTTLDIPDAPTVSVNYLTNQTNETFSSAYEYSFDGINWTKCSGKISFAPGNVAKHLRVRQAESAASFAGNITSVIIAAKPLILGDVTAEYTGAGYVIRGLDSGTYLYALTNEKGDVTLTRSLQVGTSGQASVDAAEKWTFVAIGTPASAEAPASVVRYLVPENADPNAIQIIAQPKDVKAAENEQVQFCVEAEGEGLLYRWQYQEPGENVWNSSGLTGSDTNTLSFLAVSDLNGRLFRCKITDVFGHEIMTDAVKLTVSTAAQDNPFQDVPEGVYYHDAVLWAFNHNPQITTGVTPSTFVPGGTCTRAHVVTFLWRAVGQPEPAHTESPFTDVNRDAYYYKAVLWALENGITTGVTPTTFNPNGVCTRAQVVTFMWRAAGSPNPERTDNPFLDVPKDSYYAKAVLWALENEITTGYTATMFIPNNACTRAQVVTFLYRGKDI